MATVTGSEQYAVDGTGASGRIGVVLLHGFTGSPFSMRPLADAFADEGYSVRLPLLPGHGTRWQDMNRTGWRDWYASAVAAYAELAERCDRVFVSGLSMGGGLALRLASEYSGPGSPAPGRAVAGLMLINPAVLIKNPLQPILPALKWVLPSVPAIGDDIKLVGVSEYAYPRTPLRASHSMLQFYRETRALLPRVVSPLLLFSSTTDHVVPTESGNYVWQHVSSAVKERVRLRHSYHVATLDNDAPKILERSLDFVRRFSSDEAPVGR